jgi:predicted methyltransferase
MKKAHLLVLALAALPLACEETPPPVAPPAPPPPVETAVAAPPVETAKPAEPTPEELKKAAEEKKKAEAAQKLAADRAQWEADSKVEAARWTPEVHAAANKLASTKYPTLKSALGAALKGPQRKPADAARDVYRHPLETLEFFGLKPTMTVLEYGPGEGWYTELLAPVLAEKGKLFVTGADPNGPPESRGTFYGQRFRRFLDLAPELYGKVDTIITASGPPKLGMVDKLDMVIACRELHGMHQNKLVPGFFAEVFTALKPGGVLGIEQHRAPEGANPDESAKKGYLPEAWVIQQAEAAGFKLAGKSEINANPKDTKDYAEGVWTLPPSFELKDKDHDKYAAIGESDRMTLKFVKPGKAAGKALKPKK